MTRRVVVTGLGTVNPLGMDVESFWKAAQAGVSGVGRITAFDTSDFRVHIAAEIPEFDPEQWIDKREARRLDRFDQLFWAAYRAHVAFGEWRGHIGSNAV